VKKETQSDLMNLKEVLTTLNISRSSFARVQHFPVPFSGLGLKKKKLWRRSDVQSFLNGTAEKSSSKTQTRAKKQNGIEVL